MSLCFKWIKKRKQDAREEIMKRFNISEYDVVRHSSNKLWKTFKDWKVSKKCYVYHFVVIKILNWKVKLFCNRYTQLGSNF